MRPSLLFCFVVYHADRRLWHPAGCIMSVHDDSRANFLEGKRSISRF